MIETPWDDCKVAFGIECDPDFVWHQFGLNGVDVDSLPKGWELVETDGAGARFVAVFQVEGYLTLADGSLVEGLLKSIDERAEKAVCTECYDLECPGTIECPRCGAVEHDAHAFTQIADHGMCRNCQHEQDEDSLELKIGGEA